jgi:hypothetical protein
MNDIAAPILLVFIAHQLGIRVSGLDPLSQTPDMVLKLTEQILLKVNLTSLRQIATSALPTSYLV